MQEVDFLQVVQQCRAVRGFRDTPVLPSSSVSSRLRFFRPRAMNLRRGTAFTIRNLLVTGFKTTGIQIETSTATTVETK